MSDFENELGYHPGHFTLSKKKLAVIYSLLKNDKSIFKTVKKNILPIRKTLFSGDVQPAKVISIEPLLIATYSDESDAVLILNFPNELVDKYSLSPSQRLICVNSYWPKEVFDIEPDIIPGEYCSFKWRDIIPLIPLFFTEDEEQCDVMTRLHSDELWNRFDQLIEDYLQAKPNQYREGFNLNY